MTVRRRNRKKVDNLAFPAQVAGLFVLLASFALGYVLLGCRIEALGKAIKELENKQTVLKHRYQNEELKWARMKSPENLERVLALYDIEMQWPRRDQVVRLYDTGRYRDQYARLDRLRMNEQ